MPDTTEKPKTPETGWRSLLGRGHFTTRTSGPYAAQVHSNPKGYTEVLVEEEDGAVFQGSFAGITQGQAHHITDFILSELQDESVGMSPGDVLSELQGKATGLTATAAELKTEFDRLPPEQWLPLLVERWIQPRAAGLARRAQIAIESLRKGVRG